MKKTLQSMEHDEIVNVVLELYAARKDAKDYLEYWLDPDAEKELEKCEKLVSRQFFTPQGVNRRSPSLTTVNKIVKDFMTICFEPEKVAALLLYIGEKLAEWLEFRYRRVTFRTSLKKYVDEAKLYIENHELESIYGIRLEKLTARAEAIEQWQEDYVNRRGRRGLRRWW